MSYDHLRAIRDSDLPATQRAVLGAVVLRAGEAGCWASQSTIAADTGLGERTVRRDLAALVAAGLLVASPDPGRTTTYTLGQAPAPRATLAPRAGAPAGRAGVPRHHVPPTPAPRAREMPMEEPMVISPPISPHERARAQEPTCPGPGPVTAEAAPGSPATPTSTSSASTSTPSSPTTTTTTTGATPTTPAAATAAASSLPVRTSPSDAVGTTSTIGETSSSSPSSDRTPTGIATTATGSDDLLAYAHAWLAEGGLLRGPLAPLPPRDLAALRAALRDGWTAEDVRLVGDWVRGSGERDAVWLREQRHGWAGLLSPGRARQRLDAAREWSRGGRPSAAPARTAGAPRRGVGVWDLWEGVDEVTTREVIDAV